MSKNYLQNFSHIIFFFNDINYAEVETSFSPKTTLKRSCSKTCFLAANLRELNLACCCCWNVRTDSCVRVFRANMVDTLECTAVVVVCYLLTASFQKLRKAEQFVRVKSSHSQDEQQLLTADCNILFNSHKLQTAKPKYTVSWFDIDWITIKYLYSLD